jgi:exodeoxyribonuclease VII small subunit
MAKTVPQEPIATTAGDPLPASYEVAVSELETLVGRMEGGSLSLEESLGAYRRGATLVAYCQQQLEKIENQVRVLDGATLKPFAAAETGRAAEGERES